MADAQPYELACLQIPILPLTLLLHPTPTTQPRPEWSRSPSHLPLASGRTFASSQRRVDRAATSCSLVEQRMIDPRVQPEGGERSFHPCSGSQRPLPPTGRELSLRTMHRMAVHAMHLQAHPDLDPGSGSIPAHGKEACHGSSPGSARRQTRLIILEMLVHSLGSRGQARDWTVSPRCLPQRSPAETALLHRRLRLCPGLSC